MKEEKNLSMFASIAVQNILRLLHLLPAPAQRAQQEDIDRLDK